MTRDMEGCGGVCVLPLPFTLCAGFPGCAWLSAGLLGIDNLRAGETEKKMIEQERENECAGER